MNISIEKGKMLIIKLLAVGTIDPGKGVRDIWFEVNGEVNIIDYIALGISLIPSFA
jgi:pyruvate carboxylase